MACRDDTASRLATLRDVPGSGKQLCSYSHRMGALLLRQFALLRGLVTARLNSTAKYGICWVRRTQRF